MFQNSFRKINITYCYFNKHNGLSQIKRLKRKAKAAQFRLKAAHVLWATAKCRHPGSLEAKCSSPAEVLDTSRGDWFGRREINKKKARLH
jgi:hypothetical protein